MMSKLQIVHREIDLDLCLKKKQLEKNKNRQKHN